MQVGEIKSQGTDIDIWHVSQQVFFAEQTAKKHKQLICDLVQHIKSITTMKFPDANSFTFLATYAMTLTCFTSTSSLFYMTLLLLKYNSTDFHEDQFNRPFSQKAVISIWYLDGRSFAL